jgi:hypothetical protein
LPPVQRPGVANQGAGSSRDQQIRTIQKQMETATGNAAIRLATQLYGLQQQAAARR